MLGLCGSDVTALHLRPCLSSQVCLCGMWACKCQGQRSEDYLWESVLSFRPVGPRYQTQVARLGNRYLHPWNRLTGSLFSFIFETFLKSYNPMNYIDIFKFSLNGFVYLYFTMNNLKSLLLLKGSIVGKHSD